MSKYIEGQAVNPALFSGDDIIIVVEEATGRDTYATINALRTLLDTLPIVGGTANGVLYLNGSKVVASGSGLTFDGTTFKATATLQLVDPGASRDLLIAASTTGTTHRFYSTNTAAGYSFENSSGSLMTLTALGNLGIGTSSPAAKLNTVGASGVFIENTAGGFFQQIGFRSGIGTFAYYADLEFGSATASGFGGYTPTMRLTAAGNLGLGVTPSASVLPSVESEFGILVGRSSVNIAHNAYYGSSGWAYIGSTFATQYDQDNGEHRWYTAPSGTAGNAISFSQVMTLDASGNLGIGETNPAAKLNVVASPDPTYNCQVLIGNTGGVTQKLVFSPTVSSGIGGLTDGSLVFYANGANTPRASIPAAGGMVVGTAALATNATDGFLYVPTCAGTPTGTPTTQTGTAPIVINTTNNKLYFYSGGAWRDAGP